jgi:hypothetical protein
MASWTALPYRPVTPTGFKKEEKIMKMFTFSFFFHLLSTPAGAISIGKGCPNNSYGERCATV